MVEARVCRTGILFLFLFYLLLVYSFTIGYIYLLLVFYNREDEEMKNSWAKTASSKRIDKKQHPAEKIRIDKKQHPAEKILVSCH